MATNSVRYAQLEAALALIQANSGGRIEFRKTNTRALGAELQLDLGSSPNPVYDFHVHVGAESFRAIAYTLALDGNMRAATRAEALGRGLAQENGRLFGLNPFLLVFDFTGEQLLTVPAIALFGAFADKVATEPVDPSATSTFSLTPNFANTTISMYASVGGASVRKSSLQDLDAAALVGELQRVRDSTNAAAARVPHIVSAIQTRLDQLPSAAESAFLPRVEGDLGILPIPPDQGEQQVQISPRLWRMVLTAIRSTPAVILVGPPGTGKTALLRQAIHQLSAEGLATRPPLWATPDESWSARDLIGGDTVVSGEIVFRPGWLLRSIEEDRWLILDEANRADMDRILGPVLTWLSGGNVVVGSTSASAGSQPVELGWTNGPTKVSTARGTEAEMPTQYFAGDNWRLLGTYNALDAQRVFRFGAALGRRFARVPIPAASPEIFSRILADRASKIPLDLRARVEKLYEAHYDSEATRIGPAIFLAMCRYLESALAEVSTAPANSGSAAVAGFGEPSAAYVVKTQEQHALADAYVVHAGTVLAHLEEDELAQLKERIATHDILIPEDIDWITEVIRALA